MKKLGESTNCFVCGLDNACSMKLEFYQDDQGAVVSHAIIPERYEGYPGMTHGGVIAAILDEVCGRTFIDHNTEFMVTAELNIHYRKPVLIDTPIIAKGYQVSREGRVARARGEIVDEQGNLLAEAEGVYVFVPEERIKQNNPKLRKGE
mgnify:CR=1 FL=1